MFLRWTPMKEKIKVFLGVKRNRKAEVRDCWDGTSLAWGPRWGASLTQLPICCQRPSEPRQSLVWHHGFQMGSKPEIGMSLALLHQQGRKTTSDITSAWCHTSGVWHSTPEIIPKMTPDNQTSQVSLREVTEIWKKNRCRMMLTIKRGRTRDYSVVLNNLMWVANDTT